MSVPFKSSPIEFNQHLLFPTNIFDLLTKGHECFLYADLFQQIDTSHGLTHQNEKDIEAFVLGSTSKLELNWVD